MLNNKKWGSLLLIGLMCICVGCQKNTTATSNNDGSGKGTGFIAAVPGMYDSEDKAVVVGRDTKAQTITFQNMDTGKQYTLTYDGTTSSKDKYGQEIALSQIPDGSIVVDQFYKPNKTLATIMLASDTFGYETLNNYTLDASENSLTIGVTNYRLDKNICILSEGKQVELMDLNQADTVTLQGIGNKIYSIVVDRGHGYLRLKNDDYFQGGWIEVAQSNVIRDIEKDMLLVVPEGTHGVTVSKDGNEAHQNITFGKNEELVWDLGTVAITQVQKGSLIFTLNPAEATISIDGEKVDTSKPFETEYGVHQLMAIADGYQTITQYIKLTDQYANIDITMISTEDHTEEESQETVEENQMESLTGEDASQTEANSSGENQSGSNSSESGQSGSEQSGSSQSESSSSENSSQSETSSTSSSTNYRVYVDAPESVEVYMDGNYVGVAPVDFEKKAGSYVISLRKSGYQTRSYTISIDNEAKDVHFSFSALASTEE